MKRLKLFLVIVLIFTKAISMSSCKFFKQFTVDEIEELYYEHESTFYNAATGLHEILKNSESDITISKENEYADSSNERIKVREINNLYFITVDYIYTDEEYKAMYDCVEPLFSSNIIKEGIYCCKAYIQFSIEYYLGDNSSLFFAEDEIELARIVAEIEDEKHFTPNWYALVSYS